MPDKRPAVVTARKPRPRTMSKAEAEATQPAPRIVSARKPGSQRRVVPNLSPEEVKRRGDAAEAVWRELVRRATAENA
jgi:hypothetical protein